MSEAPLAIGDAFNVQFVWKLSDANYIRAVFKAEIIDYVVKSERYLVRLIEWIAGRQEDPQGNLRPPEAYNRQYWALVERLTGHRLALAYEVADGRPLHLRLETLTGEHNFFFRFDQAAEYFGLDGSVAEEE